MNIHYNYKIQLSCLGLTKNLTWLREPLTVNKDKIFSRMAKNGVLTRMKVVKFKINWCMKQKRFGTKDLYFNITYLLKVSTRDTGTGQILIQYIFTAESGHIRIYSSSTIKRWKQTQRCCSCFSVAKFKQSCFCWKLLCFDIIVFANNHETVCETCINWSHSKAQILIRKTDTFDTVCFLHASLSRISKAKTVKRTLLQTDNFFP